MSAFSVSIRSGGAAMDRAYGLVALDIVKQVDRIPDATLTLSDRHTPEGDFPLSDADFFAPGAEIEIAANWIRQPETMLFRGRVVRHALRYDDNGPVLEIELRDVALKLTRPRRSRAFKKDTTDQEAFAQVVEDAGLTTDQVADTKLKHPALLQYRASDWDFLVARAQALGLCVVVDDGVLSLREPDLSAAADLTLQLGIDAIHALELEVDGLDQESGMTGRAWDPAAQKLTAAVSAADFALAQGDPQPAAVAKQLGFAQSELSHTVPLATDEVQGCVDGMLRRNRLAMLRGRVGLPGRPEVKPFQLVELVRVGSRFPGKALVTAVRHRFGDGGWRTDLTLGLPRRRLAEEANFVELPAAGLLPPVSGLQIGVVGEPGDESDSEQRIWVVLPVLGQDAQPILARLATPHAGTDHGLVLRPEPKDEVIVGFLNDDPRQPVILGAVFSSKQPPPGDYAQAEKDNLAKGLVTRSGTTLGFLDGDKPKLFLKTPAGNQVLLDEENEQIELKDQHGNSVLMNADGISITSAKDLIVEASGKVEIKGQSIDLI